MASIQKYIAEFIGTLVLTLAVALSLTGKFPVPTPVIAALALGYGVYALVAISGAHFNPAISLGLAAIRKLSLKDTAAYLAAQFAGAAAAAQIVRNFVIPSPAALTIGENVPVMIGEGFGAFVFAFGVAAVAHGKVSCGALGLAVGASLLLGISLAVGLGTNGVLNPAVALGIGSFSPGYLAGPVLGAMAAMLVYACLAASCSAGSCSAGKCGSKKE